VGLAQAGHARRGLPREFRAPGSGLLPAPNPSAARRSEVAMLCFEAGLLVAASLLAAFAYLNALFGLRPATVQLLRAQLCYLVSQSKHDYGNPSLSISFRVT
jgi:hypothetical protein